MNNLVRGSIYSQWKPLTVLELTFENKNATRYRKKKGIFCTGFCQVKDCYCEL